MPAPSRHAALLLILLAAPAAAKVEVPLSAQPAPQAEQGGTAAKGQKDVWPVATLPLIALGLPGVMEAELLARWAAPIRSALSAERARWRAERISNRPRRGQVPPPLRPKSGH